MAAEPPLTAFVAGGWLLVQPLVPDPERVPIYFPPDVVPAPVLTVSPCLATMLPSAWAFGESFRGRSEEDRTWGAEEWGLAPDELEEMLARADELAAADRVPWRRVFADLEGARGIATALPSSAREGRLIALALARSQVDDYLGAVDRFQAFAAGCRYASFGVEDVVARRMPLPPGGVLLGYEVLGTGAGEFHSWHCHALERDLCARLDIRLGPGGLIPTHAQACRVAEYCDSTEAACEPGVWRAWALVEYSRMPG